MKLISVFYLCIFSPPISVGTDLAKGQSPAREFLPDVSKQDSESGKLEAIGGAALYAQSQNVRRRIYKSPHYVVSSSFVLFSTSYVQIFSSVPCYQTRSMCDFPLWLWLRTSRTCFL